MIDWWFNVQPSGCVALPETYPAADPWKEYFWAVWEYAKQVDASVCKGKMK